MKFPQRKKKIITAIEVDDHLLKIVQAEAGPVGKKEIVKVSAREIGSSSPEAIGEVVSDLSKELKIDSRFLIISVPRHFATTRNIELPSANPAEIQDMVGLQIGKQTPYTKGEVISAHQILDYSSEGYSRIMIVIVHQDIVRKCLKILGKAGLSTEKIGLSSEGLLSWSHFAYQKEGFDKPYALVDVDYNNSDFEVILKDKSIFSRSISLGFLHVAEKEEEWPARFIKEVNQSIYAYQSEMPGKEIDRIIIGGAEGLTGDLDKELLRERFGLPLEIIEQFKNIPATEKVLDSYKSGLRNTSFSGLIGLVLAPEEQKINLIPQELIIERALKERGKDIYLSGIVLVFILLIISAIFWGRMYNKESYLKRDLQQRLNEIQGKVDGLSARIREIELIKERMRKGNLSLNLIHDIHSVILPEIHMFSINFNGKDRLIIRGSSRTMSAVFKFVNGLEGSEYFQNVKTKYATSRKVKDQEVTDFEIVCPLE